MRKITPKFEFVDGDFDLYEGRISVENQPKYNQVDLCFAGYFNIPFAKIKLHSKDSYSDACSVFDDAVSLGREIEKRYNIFPETIEVLTKAKEQIKDEMLIKEINNILNL